MFIVTTNPETAEKMKKRGFALVSSYPGRWTFLTPKDKKYSKEEYPDTKLTNLIAT